MRNILFWSLLGVAPLGHAHVGHHEPGTWAGVVHAFSNFTPFAPVVALLLLVWWRSRMDG